MADLRVLILEDDPFWFAEMSSVVLGQGWEPIHHETIEAVVADAAERPAGLVLVDRMLAAGRDGLDLLKRLQALEITPPIIVVTALSAAMHAATGLDAGADDYVTKPFDADELRARMRAVLRRRGVLGGYETVRRIGGLEVRTSSRTVTFEGRSLRLPDQAFDILDILSERPQEIVSRAELWSRVWPLRRNLGPQHQVIDTSMSRLRRALAEVGADHLLSSERGAGYGLKVG